MEHITKPFLGRFYATRARSGKRKKLFNLRFSLLKVQMIRSSRFLRVAFLPKKAEYCGDVDILKSKSTNVIHFNLIVSYIFLDFWKNIYIFK